VLSSPGRSKPPAHSKTNTKTALGDRASRAVAQLQTAWVILGEQGWVILAERRRALTIDRADCGTEGKPIGWNSTLAKGESRMAKLGSDKRPAVVRVRTMPKGEEIVALCERHHWKVIVGIEPDQPEDLSDIDLLLRGPVAEPPAPRAAPRIGRNDYCPCGSGKKFKNCCATP